MKTFIIFDVDGTLVYSNKADSQCFAQTYFEIYNEPFPTIDWRVYPHVTDHTIFSTVIKQQFNRNPDTEEINQFRDQFVANIKQKRMESPEEFYEVPGAKKMIDQLNEDDRFILGIATGGWESPAIIKLDFVGINRSSIYFCGADNKVTREEIVHSAIAKAISNSEAFNRIVYVGDAVWDVKTTRNLQINFIGVRRNGDLGILQSHGAGTIIQNYQNHQLFLKAIEEARPPA